MTRKKLALVMTVAVAFALVFASFAYAADEAKPDDDIMKNFNWGYIIQKAFLGAGVIGFCDILILVLCSVAVVALIIQFCMEVRRSTMMPELTVAQVKTMFDERRFREAVEFCQNDPSFVAKVIHAGLMEAANGYEAMEKSMIEAAEERSAGLYRKVEILNLLGNVCPMLGLFGTVYGMMVIFSVLSAKAGVAQAGDLSNGIMVKLFCTFLGLTAAIPALSGYSLIKGRIDALSIEATMVAGELLSNFKPTRRAAQQKEQA